LAGIPTSKTFRIKRFRQQTKPTRWCQHGHHGNKHRTIRRRCSGSKIWSRLCSGGSYY
jgi:hypothetical protein